MVSGIKQNFFCCLSFKRFKWCLQGLDSLFQKNFLKFRYFSVFVVLFGVILWWSFYEKNAMMVKKDAKEDAVFLRLICYKFNGFKTVVS